MGVEVLIKKSASDPSLILDPTTRIRDAKISCNERGFERMEGEIPLPLIQAAALFPSPGTPHATAGWNGARLFEGRLEDPALWAADVSGARFTAFGYQRAMADLPYTALWSTTDYTQFRPYTVENVAGATPELYQFDTNNRLFIGLTKGTIYGAATDGAYLGCVVPHLSSRDMIGVMFNWQTNLPVNWRLQVRTRAEDYTGAAVQKDVTPGASSGNFFLTFSGAKRLDFLLFNDTGANYTVTNETGFYYVKITNLRVVTLTTSAVNTTTTAAIAAGSNVNVPVVTTANMYVGQTLHFGIPASNGATAIVESITSATVFVADLSFAMASGGNVQAFVIYASDIVKDLLATVCATNADQLNAATIRIQSPGVDLFDETYEDRSMSSILDYLAGLGDTQSPPRVWEWGVWENRVLAFRPRGSAGRAWYINVTSLEIARTLEQMVNATYAVYKEAGGREIRTATSTDASSVRRYALTRRSAYSASTTSSVQAGVLRDVSLGDTKDPVPRASLTLDRLTSADGSIWPLWMLRPGDTITVRNVPPSIALRTRTFRVSRTEYSPAERTLDVELETPLPGLDTLLARVAAGIRGAI